MRISYYVDKKNNKIVAEGLSSLGTTYRGTSKCDVSDVFNEENGKELARLQLLIKQQIKILDSSDDWIDELLVAIERASMRRGKAVGRLIDLSIEYIDKGGNEDVIHKLIQP